jgi:hypothetical protein
MNILNQIGLKLNIVEELADALNHNDSIEAKIRKWIDMIKPSATIETDDIQPIKEIGCF